MTFRMAVVAVAALTLAACGSADKPDAAASEAPEAAEAAPGASQAAPTPTAAAAPAKGEKPTREFVVGKWGNDGDCTMAMDLKADGTSDGPFGNWAYGDGVISFPEAPEMKITVAVADAKTMDSVNAQGGKHQMTRCP